MSIVPFEPKHMEELFPMIGLPISYLLDGLKILAEPGYAYTALNKDKKPMGFAGVIPLWDGVGDAYAFMHPSMRTEFKWSLHRSVSKGLERIRVEKKLHRMQVMVEFGFKPGYRWAESLGFKWEGVMPLYTPDKKTFVRFAQVWL